jgi:hypothetical protein
MSTNFEQLPMEFEQSSLPLASATRSGARTVDEIEDAIRWLEHLDEYRNENPPPPMPESMAVEWLRCRLVKPDGAGYDLALAILLWAMGRDRPTNADEYWCNLAEMKTRGLVNEHE